MFVQTFQDVENVRTKDLQRLAASPYPVVVYGAGTYAALVEQFLARHGIPVVGRFVDSNYPRPEGVDLLAAIVSRHARFNVVLGMADHRRGRARLNDIACPNVADIVHFVLSPHYYDEIDPTFIANHAAHFAELFENLADEASRATLLGYLNTQVSGDDRHLFQIRRPDQYFPEIMKIEEREVFVDGGAYVGDTLADFLKRCRGAFGKYYAFEPDRINLGKLEDYVARNGLANVHAIGCGLWSRRETLRFTQGDQSSTESKISESGTTQIELETIDHRCPDATFIKMDIEGAELHALEGARQTIRNNRPKLAICAYHKPSHLWELAKYARSLVPEYRIYLRQHRTICTELVMYATL